MLSEQEDAVDGRRVRPQTRRDPADCLWLMRRKHLSRTPTNMGSTVKILTEEGHFKRLFFLTPDMKRSMNAWPEVLFIDGTYLLLMINLTVMILLVEDSNASSEIVGVALLAKEDYTTFKWFLETFKNENSSACERINCIMGDKDLLERDVLKEVFVDVPVYICLFHTLKIFSREITMDKMDDPKETIDGNTRRDTSTANETKDHRGKKSTKIKVNEKRIQRNKCLKALQKLAYSASEKDYEEHYTEFKKIAPLTVLDYFNKNWHVNKEEWTCYSMTSGNLFNRTNNRLESINAKIKQVVKKCSSLVDFADSFFTFLESHQHQVDLKTAKSFTRHRTIVYSANSAEYKYMELLTEESFNYILTEIRASNQVQIVKQNVVECIVEADSVTLHVTSSSCECGIARSSLLPCRHIFSVRKHLGLDLYSEYLCNERWTKAYCIKHQRSFQQTTNTNVAENAYEFPMVTDVRPEKASTVISRRKELLSVTNDLKTTCSQSCGADFTYKLGTIEKLLTSWEKKINISVHPRDEKLEGSSKQDCVQKKGNPKKQTVLQKRKVLEPLINKLVILGLKFSGDDFKNGVDIIRKIESFWRRQLNVFVQERINDEDVSIPNMVSELKSTTDPSFANPSNQLMHELLEKRFQRLLNLKPTSTTELSRIEMPLAIKRRGRPSRSMDTWINIKKRQNQKKKN